MATKLRELYDEDFYAWTQAQALREHFKGDADQEAVGEAPKTRRKRKA